MHGEKENPTVSVCEKENYASKLFIKKTKEDPEEFHICYKPEQEPSQSGSVKEFKVLSTPLTWFGRNEQPLQFVTSHDGLDDSDFRLSLKTNMSGSTALLHEWLYSRRHYYIQCARRGLKRNGYLAIWDDTLCCVSLQRNATAFQIARSRDDKLSLRACIEM